VDGTGAAARDATTVVVRESVISEIGTAWSRDPASEAIVIDCAGRTLLPGLIDDHAHIGSVGDIHPDLRRPDTAPELQSYGLAATAQRLLAGGITTVR